MWLLKAVCFNVILLFVHVTTFGTLAIDTYAKFISCKIKFQKIIHAKFHMDLLKNRGTYHTNLPISIKKSLT